MGLRRDAVNTSLNGVRDPYDVDMLIWMREASRDQVLVIYRGHWWWIMRNVERVSICLVFG